MITKSFFYSAILISLVTNPLVTFSQDSQFTQFFANPLYLNPAFTGSAGCSRAVINYRNQWPGLDGSFFTLNASYDQYVKQIRGGIGGYIMYDRAGSGTINSTTIGMPYCFPIKLRENLVLRIGVTSSLVYKKINWSKFRFGDQIDPRRGWDYETSEAAGKSSRTYPDFSYGILLHSKILHLGLVLDHIFQPNESFFDNNESSLPRKYTFHGGINIYHSSKLFGITPLIIVQNQNVFTQINLGFQSFYKMFSVGAFYRDSDAFIAMIGFELFNAKIGYSYDATISKLGNPKGGTHGAHEVALQYKFNCKNKLGKVPVIDAFTGKIQFED